MKGIIALLLVLFASHNSLCQFPRSIEAEINRYKFDQVLILPDMSIDEYPIWSEDSRNIGVNLQGKWYNLTLNEVALGQSDWKRQIIGYNYYAFLDSLKMADVEAYKKVTIYNPRKIVLRDSSYFELRMNWTSTSFIQGNQSGIEKTLWSTGGDNCHSLSLSPDGQFLAFISEGNGLMLYVLDKTYFADAVSEEQKSMNEIIRLLDSKKPKWALKLLKKELKEHPQNSEAHYFNSKLSFEKGKYKIALKSLIRAIELEPNRPFYYYVLGQTYFQANEYEKAIENYNTFVKHRPYHSYVYFNMGNAYKYAEDYDMACQMFRKVEKFYKGRAKKEISETCLD